MEPELLKLAYAWTDLGLDTQRVVTGLRYDARGWHHYIRMALESAIVRYDPAGARTRAAMQSRQDRLFKFATNSINQSYGAAEKYSRLALRRYAKVYAKKLVESGNAAAGTTLFKGVSVAVDDVVDANVFRGRTLSEWWRHQASVTRDKFVTEMRIGLANGEDTQALVRRLQGSPKGNVPAKLESRTRRIPAFNGNVMKPAVNQSEAIMRTAVNAVNNRVAWNLFHANKRTISGVAALVTLDGKTTLICMSRSGGMWDLETGRALPGSAFDGGFPGVPPWHIGCRTLLVPVDKKLSLDPKSLSFEKYAAERGDKFLEKKLGPGRYRLYREKRITFQQLIDQEGRALTLDQLEQLPTLTH